MLKQFVNFLFLITILFGVSPVQAEGSFSASESNCNSQGNLELSYEETRQCMFFYRSIALSGEKLNVKTTNLAITANSMRSFDPAVVEGQPPETGIVAGQTPESGFAEGQTPESGIVHPDTGVVAGQGPDTGAPVPSSAFIKFLGFR